MTQISRIAFYSAHMCRLLWRSAWTAKAVCKHCLNAFLKDDVYLWRHFTNSAKVSQEETCYVLPQQKVPKHHFSGVATSSNRRVPHPFFSGFIFQVNSLPFFLVQDMEHKAYQVHHKTSSQWRGALLTLCGGTSLSLFSLGHRHPRSVNLNLWFHWGTKLS